MTPADSRDGPFSEDEKNKEMSVAARKALAARRKASELTKAAMATGDPQERQELLNEALQKEIEAESFGKTAKWLSSGAFQGFIAGSGFGSVPGITLGVITGTLVGGLVTLITGGLGGAIGAGVGAIHGPFLRLGDVVGNAIGKYMPTISGWRATDEQRRTLERMLGQVKEQDSPSADELQRLAAGRAGHERTSKPDQPSLRPKANSKARRDPAPGSADHHTQGRSSPRRKPKKLEVRSQQKAVAL